MDKGKIKCQDCTKTFDSLADLNHHQTMLKKQYVLNPKVDTGLEKLGLKKRIPSAEILAGRKKIVSGVLY